ncbi:hypothetical protein VE02_01736 [Pseudogymnoascus sp. 03VT05]|nr:hypothetical protein VE02_01736 [Pseudogymnoascus sp. 03VT05]
MAAPELGVGTVMSLASQESPHCAQPEGGRPGSQIDNDDIGVRYEASKGHGKDRGIWLRRFGTIWDRAEDSWIRWLTMHFAK